MRLPSGINYSWLSDIVIPHGIFENARQLYINEQYFESKDQIDTYLTSGFGIVGDNSICGEDLWSLYAENLFYLKEYSLLKSLLLELGVTNPNEFPELFLVGIKAEFSEGKVTETISMTSLFIENNSDLIPTIFADYLALKGIAEYRRGETETAVNDLEVSYSLFSLRKDDFGMGDLANRLGNLHRKQNQYFESLRWLGRAQEAFTTLKMPRKQSMTLLNLGVTHYKSGNLPAATKNLLASHKIGKEGNWPHRMLFTNIALGNVLRMQRQTTEARKRLHTAYTQAQDLGYPREEALALEFLGDVYRDEGQHAQAQRYYARAMAIGKTIAPKGDIVMEIHRRNGECLMAQDELGEAIKELNKCIKLAKAQGDRFEEAVALRILSEIKKEAGDLDVAETFITDSTEILTEIGARFELALSLASWTELKIRQVDRGSSIIPDHLLLTQALGHANKALEHAIFTGVAPLIEECRHSSQRISALRANHQRANAKRNKLSNRPKPTNVIIHQSLVMRDMLEMTDMFANNMEPVLITGETGTGKELIARRLHMNSQRSDKKLVSVNVTTLPATMFEREMFGHVRGSFSSADQDGLGFVGEAHGGTLFLDEIGELPLEAQPKLLRLLQEGTYQALGDPTERYADIRIVAATNASLPEMVKQGKFRSDLYFRLKVLELELPPLRERDGDIPLLMRHFLIDLAGRQVELSQYFDLDTLDMLERHDWAGNIRELAVLARRAHIEMTTRGRVRVRVNRENGSSFFATGPQESFSVEDEPEMEMEAASGTDNAPTFNYANERARIVMAMDQSGGNRAEAAAALGMARSTLYRRMKRLGL